MAASLAETTGATIVALHVVELPPELRRWGKAESKSDIAFYRRLLRGQVAHAEDALREQVSTNVSQSAAIRCIARAGWVGETVVEVADQIDADVIVVARGRAGILGHHAERIVRLEGRAVLVAPVKASTRARASGPKAPPRQPTAPAAPQRRSRRV